MICFKVLVANTKRDGSVRDPHEGDKLNRIFVIIPKSFDEDELTKAFQVWQFLYCFLEGNI